MQREIPILSTTRKPVMAPSDLVSICHNRLDAIRLCVQLSGYSNETLCELLGIDRGHWTRMMQGRAYFPDTKSIDLMNVCGNLAPMQYEAQALGYTLTQDAKESRKAELRAELKKLEEAA